jgi:hypothetical protein
MNALKDPSVMASIQKLMASETMNKKLQEVAKEHNFFDDGKIPGKK